MADAAWVTIVVAGIICVTRVVVLLVALRGVPPDRRPAVLRALAECCRWWRRCG